MNERIRELSKQADGVFIHKLITGAKQYTFLEKDLEKFAELIVKECVAICQDMDGEDNIDAKSGRQDCAVEIREHFGVDE
jgi:hypothetical protein